MRYTGPKNKVSRREGVDLNLKTTGSKSHASLLKRLSVLPGQHGTRRRRKQSERGKQLREKQKLRFLFGVTESQLKKYFQRAVQTKGNTSVLLAQLLERRLDNMVFRLGFSPTRAGARQLVGHGHVKVNGTIVSIPSFLVAVGQKISFAKESSTKIPSVEESLKNKNIIVPSWLERKNSEGSLTGEPTGDDIEKQINLTSVIEFYSR